MPTNEKQWGQHLIVDLDGCPRDLISSRDNISAWIRELVNEIDMVSYGEPVIKHFANHSYEASGFTLIQMIETSAITAHFAENLGQVYIDVFSCKVFCVDCVKSVCDDFFQPSNCKEFSLLRGFNGGNNEIKNKIH